MPSWGDYANIATGAGTLLLAVASFGATRSADRAARSAEEGLLAARRPVLGPSRPGDPVQKLHWRDGHREPLRGGEGVAVRAKETGRLYLALSLRNFGPGLAVLQSWDVAPRSRMFDEPHADPAAFRPHGRDLYIPPGDIGFWHATIHPDDPQHTELTEAVAARGRIGVDVLYSDLEGGQRAITRFSLVPRGDDAWTCEVVKYWNLDRPDPR
jgi:hypothetical protein